MQLLATAGVPLAPAAPTEDRPLTADELADTIVQLSESPPTIGRLLFPGPRSAIRIVRDENRYPATPRRLPAGAPISGATMLRLIRAPLIAATGESPAVTLRRRAAPVRPRGPWVEWDLRQAADTTVTGGEGDPTTETTARTVVDLRMFASRTVEVSARARLDAAGGERADAAEPSVEPYLPAASLTIHRDADGPRDSWNGSIAAGRLVATPLRFDGVRARLATPSLSLEAGAGYTGMIARALAPLPQLPDDPVESRPVGGGDYAPERVVLAAGATGLEVLGRQNPGLQVVSILRPGGGFHLTEIEASMSGPLSPQTFYDLRGAVQIGSYRGESSRDYRGWAADGEVRWYPRIAIPARLGLRALVSSGGAAGEGLLGLDGGSGVHRGYIPVAREPLWTLYPGAPANIAALEGTATVRPTPWMIARLSAATLARITAGATGDSVVDDATGIPDGNRLLGSELGAALSIEPVGDLIFEGNTRIFVPWTTSRGGASPADRPVTWQVGLAMTVRL